MTTTAAVTFPVEFLLDASQLDELKQVAAQIDLENTGGRQSHYTVEEALVIVFHHPERFTQLVGPGRPIQGYCHAGQLPGTRHTWRPDDRIDRRSAAD